MNRPEGSEPGATSKLFKTGIRPLFITGPTAVGKSAVAQQLAETIDGEIISVDSMQVYRGLDIGTAKPSLAERRRVPHHMIDVVDLAESFDAARFVQLARRAVLDVQGRGRVPVVCGGTGLYFKAFLEGLGRAPGADWNLRAELEATPVPELLGELEGRDPVTFAKIDKKNPRRLVRALEVIRLTGQPFSAQRRAWMTIPESLPTCPGFFCLTRARDDLRRRIDARVDDMFARGLVEETNRLLARGLEQNRTALQAIGYRQAVEHLRGIRSLAETITVVKQRTWQFARRQMTWFRRQLSVDWMALSPEDSASAAAARVAAQIRRTDSKKL